jgi:hypothetical protein
MKKHRTLLSTVNIVLTGLLAIFGFSKCEGTGMHLHDDDGKLLVCHYSRIQ